MRATHLTKWHNVLTDELNVNEDYFSYLHLTNLGFRGMICLYRMIVIKEIQPTCMLILSNELLKCYYESENGFQSVKIRIL